MIDRERREAGGTRGANDAQTPAEERRSARAGAAEPSRKRYLPGARFRARLVAGLAAILLAVVALAVAVGSAARENVAALRQSNDQRQELEQIARLSGATARYVTELRESLALGVRDPASPIRTEFHIALAELERRNQVAPGLDSEGDVEQLAYVRETIGALEFGVEDALAATGDERAALIETLRGDIARARDATLHVRLQSWMDEERARAKEIEVIAEARAERLEMVAHAVPLLAALVGAVLLLATVPRVGGELGKLKKAVTALRRGDRTARVELVGGDEFTEVASAFNDMADELERVTVAKSELEAAVRELGTARHQLMQAQKMEALGRVAGGLAHDFNNMLLVISASAEFIQQELGQQSACAADVRDILDAADRARGLTQQLLALTRSRPARLEPVVLSELAVDSHRMLARVLHEGIEFVTDTAGAAWSARVDRSQLEQVLMNLVLNARDAVGASGRIVVEVRDVPGGAPEAAGSPALAGRECVVLSVRDDGAGMSEEVLERALEPFFTTKGPGAGSGLGLSTSYAVVSQAGGDFMIDSAPGRGTCIHLLFPRCADARPVVDASDGTAPPVPRGQRVMLVEDEPRARDATSRLLRSRGFEVHTAADGSAALGRLEDLDWKTDVVVSDVRMPVMDGVELTHEIHQRRPDLPIVLISGYTDRRNLDLADEDRSVVFLSKPFTSQEIVDAIGAAAGARAPRWSA